MFHHRSCCVTIAFLVIVPENEFSLNSSFNYVNRDNSNCLWRKHLPRKVISPVSLPMFLQNILDAHILVLDNWQPGEHRPNAVLLPNMIRTGSIRKQTVILFRSATITHPKLSSPHNDRRPASIKLPKYFQPVGTSNISFFNFAATLKAKEYFSAKQMKINC